LMEGYFVMFDYSKHQIGWQKSKCRRQDVNIM
jgi:hypothetical protein